MSEIGKHKLSDAIPKPDEPDQGGRPVPSPETAAEQMRQKQASEEAQQADASIRERMVDIGRAHQQGGRQGQ